MPTEQEILAAEELLKRRKARQDLQAWCAHLGLTPAQHHKLILEKLQSITDSPTPRYVILLMPPGAAKSTYASKAFPAWFLGRKVGASILACSYSATLAENFGRSARNYVENHANVLGYTLASDSKAAGEWETSHNSRYFCAGVGAGIAGHRADLGLIDDYLGNQEDADSKTVRDKQYDWFWNDFFPRLKPNASVVIIANRRHEDDLVGRLTDHKNLEMPILAQDWEVIKLPFFAEADDVLGRAVGERLWPEWFTSEMATRISRLPSRVKNGLYQQRPAPEEGDYFKREWFVGYSASELPALEDLKVYAASDHAISKSDDANKSCFGFFGVDSVGDIWWLPELFWERADSMEQAQAMLRYNKMYSPIVWGAEKGHITQSIGPFLRKMMREQNNFIRIQEIVPKKDKATRARSVQGLAALGRIKVPKYVTWWKDVEDQLLNFPASTEDDVVDMLAHVGFLIDQLVTPDLIKKSNEDLMVEPVLTYGWLRKQEKKQERKRFEFLNN